MVDYPGEFEMDELKFITTSEIYLQPNFHLSVKIKVLYYFKL